MLYSCKHGDYVVCVPVVTGCRNNGCMYNPLDGGLAVCNDRELYAV